MTQNRTSLGGRDGVGGMVTAPSRWAWMLTDLRSHLTVPATLPTTARQWGKSPIASSPALADIMWSDL